MPGSKSKNDTWTENDLLKAIQGDSKEKKHRSSRDKSSTRERDRSRHRSEKEKDERRKEKDKERSKDKRERSIGIKDDKVEKERSGRSPRHEKEENRRRDKEKDKQKNREDKEKRRSEKYEKDDLIDVDLNESKNRKPEESGVRKKDKDRRREKSRDSKSAEERKEKDSNSSSGSKEKESRRTEKGKSSEKKEKDKHRSKDKERKHKDRERTSRRYDEDRKKKDESKTKKVEPQESEQLQENNGDKQDDYNYDDDEFDDYDDDDFEDDVGDEENSEDQEDQEETEDEEESEDKKERANKMDNLNLEIGEDHVDENSPKSEINKIDSISKVESVKEIETGNNSGSENESGNETYRLDGTSKFNMSLSEKKDMNEVLQAITAENQKLANQTSSRNNSGRIVTSKRQNSVKPHQDSQPVEKKTFGKINFMAASKKQLSQKAALRNKQRGEELLKLIQLDVRSIDLFESPPMTEYELYMKRFGNSDCKQSFTQTNDENMSQEIQTEDITTENRWCQHTHDIKSCGAVFTDGSITNNSNEALATILTTDSTRLNKFLLKASKVCALLLEEIEAGIEQPQKQYAYSKTAFSDGSVTLSSSNFLTLGRDFNDVSFSPQETNMVLTAYSGSNVVEKTGRSSKSLICVWNTNKPTRPYKLLACESTPRSCCFNNGTASLVFGGMDDGVIALWDLREPDSFHEESAVGGSKETFRSATYTTARLSNVHSYPIVSIAPVTSGRSRSSSQEKGGIDMSFQLLSLDESGQINIWVIVQVHQDITDLKNNQDDLGLSPKGTIKMVKSGSISSPHLSLSPMENLFTFTCLDIDPVKSNHVYLGSVQGSIYHEMRFCSRPTPKSFHPPENCTAKVTAIDISPWEFPYLLASYSNGSISLFHLQKELPVMYWSTFSNGNSITDVRWSKSKPNVFYAIDEQSVLYICDLLKSDIQPVIEEKLLRKDKRAIGFALSNDYASLGVGTPNRVPEMALIYGDGSIEIHRLVKQLTQMEGDELDRMNQYFEEIT